MFLLKNKQINICEYTNTSVTTPRKHLKIKKGVSNPLIFNPIKLSFAIARTLASHHLNIREFRLDCIMSALNCYNIIEHNNLDFKLLESRITRLRDFTRTTKIGEIAQGLSYLFAQEELKCPVIIDFHFFLSQQGVNVPSDESTPDFICQKTKTDKNIILLESKGTEIYSLTSIKSFLSSGKGQCNNGQLIITNKGFNVINSYVTCSEFSVDTSNVKSCIHFVDPKKKRKTSPEDDTLLKFHYASWFYLIGDHLNVEQLIKGENIQFNSEDFSFFNYEGVKYYISKRGINKDLIQTGISEAIINHLRGITLLNRIPTFPITSNVSYQKKNINSFIDGTIVLIDSSLAKD